MMNVALVGPGRIAEHSLVPGLSKVPDARLWSVMSRDPRARPILRRPTRGGGRRGGPRSARHPPCRPRARRGHHRDSGQAARRADPCRGRGGQARAGRETDGDGCGVGPRHDPMPAAMPALCLQSPITCAGTPVTGSCMRVSARAPSERYGRCGCNGASRLRTRPTGVRCPRWDAGGAWREWARTVSIRFVGSWLRPAGR